MANTIRPKRSYTASSVPTAAVAGEISVNVADGKIWITNASATSQILVSSLNRSDHTGTLAVASGGTGVTTSTGSGNVVLSTSPTLVTPVLGTPSSGNLTNCTFPTLNQNTTGTAAGLSATLAVTSGGTGVTTSTGSGSNVLSTSPTLVTPILGTPTSGTLTNCTFPTLNQNTTGTAAGLSATLAISSGGTGATSANAAANAILPSQTSNSGKYLTTNGTDTSWGTVSSGSTLPTGALMPYAGASAPTGYLLCDGSSVSSTSYLALHAVISNTYGGSAYTGAGALSFNLPDLRGRLPMGAGTGTGLNASGTGAPSGTAQTARTMGQWLGEETHLLTATELASHTHANTVGSSAGGSNSITGAMSQNENHTHSSGATGFWVYNSGLGATIAGGSTYNASAGGSANTASTNLAHTHTIGINNVANTPSGSRHDTIPPVVVLNYIIKT